MLRIAALRGTVLCHAVLRCVALRNTALLCATIRCFVFCCAALRFAGFGLDCTVLRKRVEGRCVA